MTIGSLITFKHLMNWYPHQCYCFYFIYSNLAYLVTVDNRETLNVVFSFVCKRQSVILAFVDDVLEPILLHLFYVR